MKLTEKQKAYEKELLKIIKERKIMFFSHAFAYTSFSAATAYNHNLEKLDTIKDALAKNRASGVTYMLNKWIGSDNATLQIAAMKIIADEELRRSLNQQYLEQTIKEQPLFNIDVKETSDSKNDK
jgi:ketol-acid reductoisomerase